MSILEHRPNLTWLHLSDLHLCNVKTGWDANRVLKGLIPDMQEMEKKHGLSPDFLFFTGDAAFGQLGSKPGEKISDQFDEMEQLLNGVRKAFSHPIPKTNVFLVPGNHDVNRNRPRFPWFACEEILGPAAAEDDRPPFSTADGCLLYCVGL